MRLLLLCVFAATLVLGQLSQGVATDKQLEELQKDSTLAKQKVVGKQDVSF